MKSGFLCSYIDARYVASYGAWQLLAPVVYFSDLLDADIYVPSGFVTDFSSVPRWIPVAYAVTGNTGHGAAVVHDYLYQTHRLPAHAPPRIIDVSRFLADEVFYEAGLAWGEPAWRMRLMYAGLRVGGGWAYHEGPSRFYQFDNWHVVAVGPLDAPQRGWLG
jgi:hypothetical protein